MVEAALGCWEPEEGVKSGGRSRDAQTVPAVRASRGQANRSLQTLWTLSSADFGLSTGGVSLKHRLSHRLSCLMFPVVLPIPPPAT